LQKRALLKKVEFPQRSWRFPKEGRLIIKGRLSLWGKWRLMLPCFFKQAQAKHGHIVGRASAATQLGLVQNVVGKRLGVAFLAKRKKV
jgi:hypothetical protein